MSNVYNVFNTTSEHEFSRFLDKLDLTTNELINLTYITENNSLSLNDKRTKILEMMAGSADGNYELCIEQFRKSSKQRVLKESSQLNLNQIMELNDLVSIVANKLSAPNCMKGLYNIIKGKLGSEVANTFLGMVQQSSVNDSNLKFNTDLQVNGKNLADMIYQIKNEIEMFANSVECEKEEKKEDSTKTITESYSKYKQVVDEINQVLDDVSDINVLKTVSQKVEELFKKVKNMNEANQIAELKSKIETKLGSLTDTKPQIEECVAQQVVSSVCEDDTFNGLLQSLRPTVINITVNKEGDMDETICNPENTIKALASHINCQKSDCVENNLEELETINTLLSSLSNYFEATLTESVDLSKDEITREDLRMIDEYDINKSKEWQFKGMKRTFNVQGYSVNPNGHVIFHIHYNGESIHGINDGVITAQGFDEMMKDGRLTCLTPSEEEWDGEEECFEQKYDKEYKKYLYGKKMVKESVDNRPQICKDMEKTFSDVGDIWKNNYNHKEYKVSDIVRKKEHYDDYEINVPYYILTLANGGNDARECSDYILHRDYIMVSKYDKDENEEYWDGEDDEDELMENNNVLPSGTYNIIVSNIEVDDYEEGEYNIHGEKELTINHEISNDLDEEIKEAILEDMGEPINGSIEVINYDYQIVDKNNKGKLEEDTVYDHSWYEVEGQKYPKRTKNGVEIKEGIKDWFKKDDRKYRIEMGSNGAYLSKDKKHIVGDKNDALIISGYKKALKLAKWLNDYEGTTIYHPIEVNSDEEFYNELMKEPGMRDSETKWIMGKNKSEKELNENSANESEYKVGQKLMYKKNGTTYVIDKVKGKYYDIKDSYSNKVYPVYKNTLDSEFKLLKEALEDEEVRDDTSEVKKQKYPKRTKNGVIGLPIEETASVGATCSANVSGFAKPLGSKPKKRKKSTIELDMFKESVQNGLHSALEINGKMVAYRIFEGKGYLYIDNAILKATNKEAILEAIDDIYNDCLETPVLEGFTPYQLEILMEEDMNTNTVITPKEKKEQQDELDNQIQLNPNLKVGYTDENSSTIEDNQELVGVDDSDMNDKKYVVRDPSTGKVKIANASQIKVIGN